MQNNVGDSDMFEDKPKDVLLRASENLAKASEESIDIYELYLLDESDWRKLAKTMTRLRSALAQYYAAGGK